MMIDEYLDYDTDSTVTNLFECFPMVENLSTCISTIEGFAENGLPQVLPMPLIHLKYVYISDMSFMYKYGLQFLLFLIRSSPNLEKLKLQVDDRYYYYCEDPVLQSHKCSSTLQNCSDIWLKHLNVLEILDLSNKKHELDFVKFILAKSPMLKKVKIYLCKRAHKDDKLQVSEILLSTQRASLVVEIIVENVV
ncbi:hypothetical protein L1987_00466 [Smallanthus sonchifolius]|uniref:Uncharacterized protein n=1 Tax=Smallanthus sonchifolius TaxID=185202 RepID=A0ACB9K2E8_9ASTR|nr:hypothetical protein L1987_00466 [Smallanthus sonchifolius]